MSTGPYWQPPALSAIIAAMSFQHEVRKLFWKLGYDLSRFTESPTARRQRLMHHYGIDLVLDVGANIGQYASRLRSDMGYHGRVISFEPLSKAFEQLKTTASGDAHWEIHHCALGDRNGQQTINIAGNSYSSSLLEMLPAHLQSAPESAFVGQENIEVKTLDSLFPSLHRGEKNIYLKIDTQGFESQVLAGAEQSLRQIDTLQLELSLVPLYKDQLLLDQIVSFLRHKGYSLVSLEPGFADERSGQLLQADGIFHRL